MDRRDVLAARSHQNLFLAARDIEETIAAEPAEVAGAKPALVQDLGGCSRVLVIARHNVRSTSENLAVGGNSHFDARNRPAAGAAVMLSWRGDGDDGRRLREAIALQQQHAVMV